MGLLNTTSLVRNYPSTSHGLPRHAGLRSPLERRKDRLGGLFFDKNPVRGLLGKHPAKGALLLWPEPVRSEVGRLILGLVPFAGGELEARELLERHLRVLCDPPRGTHLTVGRGPWQVGSGSVDQARRVDPDTEAPGITDPAHLNHKSVRAGLKRLLILCGLELVLARLELVPGHPVPLEGRFHRRASRVWSKVAVN